MNPKLHWCLFLTIFFGIYINSSVGDVEGLVVSPMPELVNSRLLYYQATNRSSILKWTTIIDGFLDEYRKQGSAAENRVSCSYTSGPANENQACEVPIDDFHPCNANNQYNYRKSAPCVFLKLNNNLNWIPEMYNNSQDLPQAMPDDLKQHINMVSGKPEANTVWVSCEGENPADKEYIGPVQYIPRRGFPSYYYPFTNKEGYLSPLVAVFFERPMTGVLINIECKAWAKNIDGSSQRRGSFHFELMVD